MMQAMTGRLLSVARDVNGARERAASPNRLPAAPIKQVCRTVSKLVHEQATARI